MAALRGPEIAELTKALLSAFDRDSLAVMVLTSLDKNLDVIALGDSLEAVVSHLISWTQQHGRTEDLIRGAFACNPENPELKEFVQKHNQQLLSQASTAPPPKLHRTVYGVFGAIALLIFTVAAVTVLGWSSLWSSSLPSLGNSLASAFSPVTQPEPEIKLDAAKINFVVTRQNGDINQYPAGRVMRVAPGDSLLIEVGVAAGDTSFSHKLAYRYFAARGSVQATNMGHTASYVAPLQPGTDILSVEIMRPDDPFKMTRSLYIWVSE